MTEKRPAHSASRVRIACHPLAALAVATALAAALAAPAAAAEPKRNPLAPTDTSSPRATFEGFIASCNEVYAIIRAERSVRRKNPRVEILIKQILDCLDLSEQPEYARRQVGGEAAVCLKEVLDRVELPPYSAIPDAEAVEAAGGFEQLQRWRLPGTRITITAPKEGPRRGEYLFSPEVIANAPDYFDAAKDMPYRSEGPEVTEGFYEWYLSEPILPAVAALVHELPDWCRTRAGGLAVWQWVGLSLAVAICLLAMYLIYRFGRRRGRLMRERGAFRYSLTLVFPALAMLVPVAFKWFVSYGLTLRGMPLYAAIFAANVVFLLTAMVVIVGAGLRVAELIIASPRIQPEGLDAQLIRIVSKLLSLTAAIFVFLEGGRYLGFPLTTLLASAGVGGLAIALAAQDTLKSIFGSIMILLDKPYRAGERVIVGDYDGIVEEIGLRSTKIRLLTGHVACIPNEEMARSRIENVGRRPHIRRITDLRVPLDTPREKVEKAVETVRQALADHEGMDPDFPPRVYFNDFNPDSFNIRIIYWYHPPNYWDFLAQSEKLNLEIFRAFDEHEIQFSLPTRVTYTTIESKPGALELKTSGSAD